MTPATYAPPNLGNLTTPPARYHKCGPGGSYTFNLSLSLRDVVTSPGTLTTGQTLDLVTETEAGAAVRTDVLAVVDYQQAALADPKEVTLESSDTAIVTDPVDNVGECLATGTVTITARADDGEVSSRTVSVQVTSSATKTYWTGYSEGSLVSHCNAAVNGLIAGKGRQSMDLWSLRNNAASSYQWSEGCWAAGIPNITCMSPYNTAQGNGGGGCLITPRHVMFTHHLNYYPKVGAQIRYVRPDNVTESFTITDVEAHPLTEGYIIAWHDVVICKLDRDVPPSIQFAKVLPANPKPYFPSIKSDGLFGTGVGIGARTGVGPYVRSCFTTQNKRLATAYLRLLPDSVPPNPSLDTAPIGVDVFARHVHRADGWEVKNYPANPLGDEIIRGDSGAPAFIVVNNELVLINLWTSVGSGFGYYADATTINGMLDELGGGYNLTEVDLSGFPTW